MSRTVRSCYICDRTKAADSPNGKIQAKTSFQNDRGFGDHRRGEIFARVEISAAFLACLLVEIDQMTEAGQQIDAVLKSVPQFTLREANRVYPYANSSERNYFLDDLRKAGLPD